MKTLGQIGYEAYNAAKGGLTYDGKPIPPWDSLSGDVGESVKRAWELAVCAAISADIQTAPAYRMIEIAREKLREAKGREVALTITKLDEAEMWFYRIPVQAP